MKRKQGNGVFPVYAELRVIVIALLVLWFWFLRKGGDGVRNLFGGTKGDRGDALSP